MQTHNSPLVANKGVTMVTAWTPLLAPIGILLNIKKEAKESAGDHQGLSAPQV